MIAGQPGAPDTTGVTAGNSKTYTFAAGVLQARHLPLRSRADRRRAAPGGNGPLRRPDRAPDRRTAPGVRRSRTRPSPTRRCWCSARSTRPSTPPRPRFDMTAFAPKYWLINGKGYPNTDSIATAAGNTVLLRYVNAGLAAPLDGPAWPAPDDHRDRWHSRPPTSPGWWPRPSRPAARWIPSSPCRPAAPTGTQYAVFEAAMHMDNNGAATGGVDQLRRHADVPDGLRGDHAPPAGPVTSAVSLVAQPEQRLGGSRPHAPTHLDRRT